MLTDAKIRRIKSPEKPTKVTDSHGLHLYLTPAGGRFWRYRYQIKGKEKLLSLGEYPSLSLAEARHARDEAKAILKSGKDPADAKRQRTAQQTADQENTFEVIARDWFDLNKDQWTEKHTSDVWRSLEKEVLPAIGQMAIKEITARQVLEMLRVVEKRGAKETARRIRQRVSAVFVFGIGSGVCDNDPAAQVEKAMAPIKRGRQPAITDLEECRAIVRAVDTEPAHPVTKLAHRILALTAIRPGTLITTPWSEWQDLEEKDCIWTIPAARMKLRKQYKEDENRDHLVPLSRQAVEAIATLRKITGRGPLAFPNSRHAHKPMSENAIGYLLNRAGYHHRHVPHGWRSSFSTILNEVYPDERTVIDFSLAHVPKDKVEAAYNRALYLKQRTRLFQEWADMLMEDQMPLAQVIHLPRKTPNYGRQAKSDG
ncbi:MULTISPECIES: integrase arm-type DNA-binding domain-containing protein [unclassified Roseibium]|uniref:tyrosine-type recombinase/integrase n=1 Tax=unclassified Roseibium TaxID=2629323 RepID=UPI002740166D|nr:MULTISPECIES: integrase arm-type DNA-binding domain-containing protein [unclassified Roseibium]